MLENVRPFSACIGISIRQGVEIEGSLEMGKSIEIICIYSLLKDSVGNDEPY